MKRIASRVLLFLLLGALINIAVAWGCAIWAPLLAKGPSVWHQPLPSELSAQLPQRWLAAANGVSVGIEESDGLGVTERTVIVDAKSRYLVNKIDFDHKMHVHQCGWPAPALTCTILADFWAGPQPRRPANTAVWSGGMAIPRWLRPHSSDPLFIHPFNRALPFVPLASGFFVNTVLYGGALWLLGFLIVSRLRRSKQARGLCPSCAYPTGTSPVCSECGKPVRPRAEGPA